MLDVGFAVSLHILEETMQAFELAELITQREWTSNAYLEFLKVPDLSMGLYFLLAGGVDPQSPHTEDEVYYVVSGRAKITSVPELGSLLMPNVPPCASITRCAMNKP